MFKKFVFRKVIESRNVNLKLKLKMVKIFKRDLKFLNVKYRNFRKFLAGLLRSLEEKNFTT